MIESHGNESSWSGRWYGFLSGLGYDLQRGRSLARRMRPLSVEVQSGRILAQVEDRERIACSVEIEVVPLRDEEWSAVLDTLAGEALHAAQLLAGAAHWETVRSVFDTVFADAQVSLLPPAAEADEIVARCAVCARQPPPCKHALAVLCLVGQMITEDPWLLLRLRGRDRQQLLVALRRRRSDGVAEPSAKPGAASGLSGSALPGRAAAGRSADAPGEESALAAQIDAFWGRRPPGPAGAPQDHRALHYNFNPPVIRLALLRRLGPPPFPQDSLEIYERLAHIYLEVSAKALALAFMPEPDRDSTS